MTTGFITAKWSNNFFYPQALTEPVDNFCTGFIAGLTLFITFPLFYYAIYPLSYPQLSTGLFLPLNYLPAFRLFRSGSRPADTFSFPLS